MSYICYLSLGANLGDRAESLRQALRSITQIPRTSLIQVSSFYLTEPWGKTDQPAFINAAAAVRTTLPPPDLLRALQSIEQRLGRVRHEHWGARTIDIDLVYAGSVEWQTPELQLPHPYLTQRAFVLVPLAELAPELCIAGRPICSWLSEPAVAADRATMRLAADVPLPQPLSLIACVDAHDGLSYQGQLLFDLPDDLAFFRAKTTGGIVIMGYGTYASLPGRRPLLERDNIVLTRHHDPQGFIACRDLSELRARLFEIQRPGQRAWVIGGAEIYRLLLPYTDDIWLTRVAAERKADRFLPPLDGFEQREIKPGPASDPAYAYDHYIRQQAPTNI